MLHKAGASFGKRLNPEQPANPAGFFEDLEFMSLHMHALSQVGASWDVPPMAGGLRSIAAGDFQECAQTLIAAKHKEAQEQGCDAWGFKDHRATWLLTLYAPVLAQHDVTYIVTHRNPLAAAQSFLRVWPLKYATLDKALKLVAQYELCIASFLEGQAQPRVHVSFEHLFDDTQNALQDLEQALGRTVARGHLDGELRHF
jgi:hypothetical protein